MGKIKDYMQAGEVGPWTEPLFIVGERVRYVGMAWEMFKGHIGEVVEYDQDDQAPYRVRFPMGEIDSRHRELGYLPCVEGSLAPFIGGDAVAATEARLVALSVPIPTGLRVGDVVGVLSGAYSPHAGITGEVVELSHCAAIGCTEHGESAAMARVSLDNGSRPWVACSDLELVYPYTHPADPALTYGRSHVG